MDLNCRDAFRSCSRDSDDILTTTLVLAFIKILNVLVTIIFHVLQFLCFTDVYKWDSLCCIFEFISSELYMQIA